MFKYKRVWRHLFAFAICLLLARTAGAQAPQPFLPGDLVVSLGNFLTGSSTPGNPNEILEFTRAGALIQSFPMQCPVGSTNMPNADFVGPNGNLYIFNGRAAPQFPPFISIFNPSTDAWTYYTCADWSGGDFQIYGITTLGNYTYVSNFNSGTDTTNGIIVFNDITGAVQEFCPGVYYQSLCIGWDGLLYAINNDQILPPNLYSGTVVDVYNPTTMAHIRSFQLAADPYAGDTMHSIAVDKIGGILCVGNGGVIYHYDANLNLLNTAGTVNKADFGNDEGYNIALSSDGRIAVSNANGYIYLTDETLANVTSFQAYSAPNQNTWDEFVAFAPLPAVASLSLTPTTIVGGTKPTATVTLSGNAPVGGAAVVITSGNTAVIPNISSVSVAAGTKSASIPVTTKPVTAKTTVTLTATYAGYSATTAVTVAPISVSSFTVSPSLITGGISASGTVTINSPAPTGGEPVSWTSNNTAVIPNGSGTVPAGKTSATFAIATKTVATTQSVKLTTTLNGSSVSATVSVVPTAAASFTTSPTQVIGGVNITGEIQLTAEAPAGGAVITLKSNNTAAIPIQSSVPVAAGQKQVSFTIKTLAVTGNQTVTLTASVNGVSASAVVVVVPTEVVSISVSPNSILGGSISTGTVNLKVPAPAGGINVALTSSNRTAVPIASSVTVTAGKTTASFSIITDPVATSTKVTITATLNGSATAALTVTPPTVTKLTLSPTSVLGGTSVTGSITLNGNAPSGGIAIALTSSNRGAVPVASSVTVQAGKSTASFSIPTDPVAANAKVTITASLNGSATATLTVTPPAVAKFTLSTSSAKGGASLTGTLTLTGIAPSGGITVTLTSSNRSAVPIVASVKIPAGKTSQTFTITTDKVSSNVSVTLTATLNGTATAKLAVAH